MGYLPYCPPFCILFFRRNKNTILEGNFIFNCSRSPDFYATNDFTDKLKDAEVLISMDGKGRAMDNIFIERLWRSVKYEEIYLKEYESVRELTDCLKVYFDFYNNERTHSSLGAKTPSEIYWGCMQRAAA